MNVRVDEPFLKSALMTLLRDETRALHEEVERALDVMRQDLTSTAYRSFLLAQAHVVLAVERALRGVDGVVQHVPDLARRLRGEVLLHDLHALGVGSRELAKFPALAVGFSTIGGALGALYVLEGSTLGAALIRKHVRMVLGAEVPVAYLSGYGDETGRMWRTLSLQIGEAAHALACDDEIVHAAKATFACFRDAFTRQELNRGAR